MPLKIFSEDEQKPLSGVKNVIAIAAGKGGVGKSTVTVNLALALHKLGYAVGVMDTDIYGPSVRKMLPEERLPIQKGQDIQPALCQGIRMISMAYFRPENEASVVRAPIANGIISQFINNIVWGDLDYLLIDFPPGTGDIQLTLSQKANLTGAIMVTTPQEVAVMDVRKAMNLFEQVSVPVIGIVENMSYYTYPQTQEKVYLFGKGGGERLARESGVPFLGAIPIDPVLCQSGDSGKSIFATENQGSHEISTVFTELANHMIEHVEVLKGQTANCLSQFELSWKEIS